MENIKLVKRGNTHTEKLVGTITIDVYEDSFEVKASEKIDLMTVWMVATGMQDYLEELAETLDTAPSSMIH
jgi:hypothetical protein